MLLEDLQKIKELRLLKWPRILLITQQVEEYKYLNHQLNL